MYRSQYSAGLSESGGGGATRYAEVGHLHHAVNGQQDILRLDVSMDQTAGMGGAERRAHFNRDPYGLGHRKWPGRLNRLLHGLAIHQFHNDILEGAVLTYIEHSQYVGMGEAGGVPCFLFKSAQEVGIVGKLSRQHLNGDAPTQSQVFGFMHARHAALAKDTDQAVAATQYLFVHALQGNMVVALRENGCGRPVTGDCRMVLVPPVTIE
jgi:hypothetical protein